MDQQGQPLTHIFVHAVLVQTGMFMSAVESDDTGQFLVEGLEPGTYDVFGESQAAGYPNPTMPFYGNEAPKRVTIGNGDMATVVLILGPVSGVLSGTVVDRTSGQAVASQRAIKFTVKNPSNPQSALLFLGPAKFRWLIPPAVAVTLEVRADGYKPWSYTDPSNPSTPATLQLKSGEERRLKIKLERKAQHRDQSDCSSNNFTAHFGLSYQ